jgi:hypothetical protein
MLANDETPFFRSEKLEAVAAAVKSTGCVATAALEMATAVDAAAGKLPPYVYPKLNRTQTIHI